MQLHETLSSSSLFHFTSSYENLKSILSNDFVPRYCCEIFNYDTLEDNSTVVKGAFPIPMVSFCDIPLSKIKNHSNFYGEYAIGLSKNWGIASGISPVMYYSYHSNLFDKVVQKIQFYKENSKKFIDSIDRIIAQSGEDKDYVLDLLRPVLNDMLLFMTLLYTMKPYKGMMYRNGEFLNNINFYNEREWRFAPFVNNQDTISILQNFSIERFKKLSGEDKIYKNAVLKFQPNDVKYLIVKDEESVKRLYNEITEIKGKKYSYEDIIMLQTRILTIDQVLEDF